MPNMYETEHYRKINTMGHTKHIVEHIQNRAHMGTVPMMAKDSQTMSLIAPLLYFVSPTLPTTILPAYRVYISRCSGRPSCNTRRASTHTQCYKANPHS